MKLRLKVVRIPAGVAPGEGAILECRYHDRDDAFRWIEQNTKHYDSHEDPVRSYLADYQEDEEMLNSGKLRRDCWVIKVDDEPELNEFGVVCP